MSDKKVLDLRAFIGAKDYAMSLDFYCEMGWRAAYRGSDISLLQLDDHRFYLQNYYHREWCHNTMLHISVPSAQYWFDNASSLINSGSYGEARVQAPQRQDYGALVTFVWDPCGVLLHFAEFDDE